MFSPTNRKDLIKIVMNEYFHYKNSKLVSFWLYGVFVLDMLQLSGRKVKRWWLISYKRGDAYGS